MVGGTPPGSNRTETPSRNLVIHALPWRVAAFLMGGLLASRASAVPPALERLVDEVPLADGMALWMPFEHGTAGRVARA